ncbi:hypothetical protein AS96_04500 [Microbacterium sp. MRS-1]|nr:hypothetical protein AS96_04500 [Microbacterium sp. MRS-1]
MGLLIPVPEASSCRVVTARAATGHRHRGTGRASRKGPATATGRSGASHPALVSSTHSTTRNTRYTATTRTRRVRPGTRVVITHAAPSVVASSSGRYRVSVNWGTSVSYSITMISAAPSTPAARAIRGGAGTCRSVPVSRPISTHRVPITDSRCGGDQSTASRPNAVCQNASAGAAAAVATAAATARANPGVRNTAATDRVAASRRHPQPAITTPTVRIDAYSSRCGGMKVLSRPRVVCQESSQYADPTPAAAAAAATQTPPAPSAGEPRAGSGSDGMGARSRLPCGRMVCPFCDAAGSRSGPGG